MNARYWVKVIAWLIPLFAVSVIMESILFSPGTDLGVKSVVSTVFGAVSGLVALALAWLEWPLHKSIVMHLHRRTSNRE